MSKEKFTPTMESLRKFECPDWFRDAKFGIWSHWGPQSVPMYGDWYARNMYIEGSAQYLYHLRHYGHPSKFGYKDIVKLWKAENFKPDELMDLYHKAGARYFIGQAMHHDHFFNFPSKHNRFNSTKVGPMKDICGMWKAAADNMKMNFGLTEHLGATFSWWAVNKGADKQGPYAGVPYDGNDPEYRDFYLDNYEHYDKEDPEAIKAWLTQNKKFQEYWLDVFKEIVDLYTPDMLYSDSGLPFGSYNSETPNDPRYEIGLKAVSYLYNASIDKYGENRAIYTHKDRRPEIYSVGVLDIEKSQLPGIMPNPWQTDTCIGNWFYDVRQEFKKPGHVIEMLIDIIAKNGTMLLNILQLPDGTIDNETRFLLKELAGWFEICGRAVYATRPYRVPGEGESRVIMEGFTEVAVEWQSSDFRFVRKDNNVYAFIMRPPENGVVVIKSIKEKVKSVRLLGDGELTFEQTLGSLAIKLPDVLPTKYTNCLEIGV